MTIRQFRPLETKAQYSDTIEIALKKFFDKYIYDGMFSLIETRLGERFNYSDKLLEAIQQGKIQYVDGGFIGQFSSDISKDLREIGAKYRANKNKWLIAQDKLPDQVKQTISSAVRFFQNVQDEVIDYLDNVRIGDVVEALSLEDTYVKILKDSDKDFKDIVKTIQVEPTIDKEMFGVISKDYTNNMKLYIKDFTQKEIKRLRGQVYENTFAGFRADNLVKLIQKSYGVTENKARFLARQETSLLVSTFKQQRFKSVGINRYKWSTSHDDRVRDRHQKLDGKIFSWDNPPVIDEKGNRGHPKEAFGCRCETIPILELMRDDE